MLGEVEEPHFFVRDFDSLFIDVGGHLGGYGEAVLCRCSADEVESLVDIAERFVGPVSTDLAEQSVFNRIPLGSAGRVVGNGDSETQPNAEMVLNRFLLRTVSSCRQTLYHWTRLFAVGERVERNWSPTEFAGMRAVGSTRGADVTWRLLAGCAGPGYFVLGDAARRLQIRRPRTVCRGR